MVRGRKYRFAVARPCKTIDRTIPILRERPFHAGLQVEQHQMKSIGFETGPIHRRVGELRAVRRECGLSVPRFVVGGEIFRPPAAVGGDGIEVKNRRPPLPFPSSPPRKPRKGARTAMHSLPAPPPLTQPLTPS